MKIKINGTTYKIKFVEKIKYKGKPCSGKLAGIIDKRILFKDIDEILQRNVVAVGNGAHINMPKKHIGKEVQITIWKDNQNKEEASQK